MDQYAPRIRFVWPVHPMYDIGKAIVNYPQIQNIHEWYEPAENVWFIIALQTVLNILYTCGYDMGLL